MGSRSIDLLRTIKKILTFSARDLHEYQEEPVQFVNTIVNFLENRSAEDAETTAPTDNYNFVHFEDITDNL